MNKAVDQPVFVWLWSPKGPYRQKWAMRSLSPSGKDEYWDQKIISVHEITQEQFDNLTLEQLEARFPRPTGAKIHDNL